MTINYQEKSNNLNLTNLQNENSYQQANTSQFSSLPPPPYQMHQSNQNNVGSEARFRDIITKYEITEYFSSKLNILFSYKIVFVCDDSGSMNTALEDSPLNTGLLKASRWDELQHFVKIVIEITNVFNQEGTDVYFLNRPMVQNVLTFEQLMPTFSNKPSGYTPLRRVVQSVLDKNNLRTLNERKLLLIIVTDGEPTDDSGRVDIQGFKNVLESRNSNTFTTIVSCTDDDNTMKYLNNWDRKIPRLDVVDDYRNERAEVQKAKGKSFSFSFGDYVVKSLIGSIVPELDNLDEGNKCFCTIL